MVFDLEGKIALITGGASGLGFHYAKELLRHGAKGLTLADISLKFKEEALQELEKEFGPNKAIFVHTDVTNIQQFEDAFKKTIETFKNVDILINNAGIMNDSIWEAEIAANINGTIHGMLLGMDKYLPLHKQGEEALIINITSVTATQPSGNMPVYGCTKHAVLGITRSWGIPEFYEETKTRVIALCPGVTITALVTDRAGRTLGEKYQKYQDATFKYKPVQQPEFLAKEAMKVIKYAPNGSVWIIEGGEPPYEYVVPSRITMKNNVLQSSK